MTKTFAGLSLERPLIMGIVNATPDSFSDGGDTYRFDDAVQRGVLMMRQGADIIDVGGESTRPGAAPVSIDEEIRRTIPVVKALVGQGAVVSIDTRHADVMEAGLDAGAAIINDVTALEGEERSLDVVARSSAPVILMHMQGTPGTMQKDPVYNDVVHDVFAYLKARIDVCEAAGIARDRLCVDPGIGFGKTLDHNLLILKHLDVYKDLDVPLLLGVSRKSFIGKITGEHDAKQRLGGSIAAALDGVQRGASILRVHDVGETKQALDVWAAIGQID